MKKTNLEEKIEIAKQRIAELNIGDYKMITKEKQKAQVKSKFYYIFWGVATVSVVLGQLYVGSGYRVFANSLLRIFDAIEVEVGRDYNGEFYY